jgi:hypothetical protein
MPQQMPQNPMQQGAAGGKGGMPGAQNPMQQGQMPQNPYMQQMMRNQMQPMGQQGAAGGKGGMPGAGPAPNAMQQFSQQQGLAGMLGPQQSSTNSLQ